MQDFSCVLSSLLFSSPSLILVSVFLGFNCLCLYSLPDPFFPTPLSFVPVYSFYMFFLIYDWMKAGLENGRDPVQNFHCTCGWRMMVQGGERPPCPAFPLLYLADWFMVFLICVWSVVRCCTHVPINWEKLVFYWEDKKGIWREAFKGEAIWRWEKPWGATDLNGRQWWHG